MEGYCCHSIRHESVRLDLKVPVMKIEINFPNVKPQATKSFIVSMASEITPCLITLKISFQIN